MNLPKGTGSFEFLGLALDKELDSVNDYLSTVGITNDEHVVLTEEQLSRKLADGVIDEELQTSLTKKSVNEVAAAMRTAHESCRARRDINILQASHKQLMLSCCRIMYQRKQKLTNKKEKKEYV